MPAGLHCTVSIAIDIFLALLVFPCRFFCFVLSWYNSSCVWVPFALFRISLVVELLLSMVDFFFFFAYIVFFVSGIVFSLVCLVMGEVA